MSLRNTPKIIQNFNKIQNRIWMFHIPISKKIIPEDFKSYLPHSSKTGTRSFQDIPSRKSNLALKCYMKLKSDPTNPAHNNTFRPKCKILFQKKEKAIKTFRLRMKSICQEVNIPITKIHETFAFKTPPWNIMTPETDLSLGQYYKEKHLPGI